MENSRLLFAFDKKSMKGAFYVPFFMWGVALLGILFYASMEKDYYNHFIIVQGIFLPFCCWHLVYRYSELLVHGAEDTLFPYYRKWFFYDIARYGILYSFLLIVLLLIIGIKGGGGAAVFDNITLAHLSVLLLFYLFGGLALLFMMRSVELTLAIIFIYTVIEVVTLGTSGLPWPHIFIFLPPLPEDPEMTKKFTFLLLTTVSMALYVAKKIRLF
ncbi:hypothetical protein MHB44_17540 [Lysinibacillus sp. FSL H8-0500]|uniref:hypothetical protein n=1 Tax=Lysinibacillus sp. FSL H8-0500 TaxID=2921393 RepID=UPI003100B303